MGKHYSHLTFFQRSKIEALYEAGLTQAKIAENIGVSKATICRELKMGLYYKLDSRTYEHIKAYSCDLAHERHKKAWRETGPDLKIGNDLKLLRFIENMILNHKYSPAASLAEIDRRGLEFDTKICLTTVYNYIKKGVFLNLELSDCPQRQAAPKKRKKKVQKRFSKGKSIEERPKDIDSREEFGHWEMDTVVGPLGKSQKTLLVLTERKTRKEIIEPLKRHTTREVVRMLNRIERDFGEKKFRVIFKTITVDNGSEFADFVGIENSRRNKKKRTNVYYCHPYCSTERGSNENQNKMIRRFVPKGINFDNKTRNEIKEIEHWMNHYPRPMFNNHTAEELYQQELAQIVA